MSTSPFDSPLAGVTVLSLAEQLPGPLCTRLLAELGATVIQLERPSGGDPQRAVNPWLFRSHAFGKKSVVLDLKKPKALRVARLLAGKSQVVVEGFRPGVVRRLGLAYEELRKSNPKLVYCSITGYGQDGPASNVVGHNINYEAVSGALDPFIAEGTRFTYFPSGAPLGDLFAGALATVGIVAGLKQADRDGVGTYIDLSIADSLVFAMAHVLTGRINSDAGWSDREAGYGIFRSADGHVALGIAHEDDFWVALCRIVGLGKYSDLDHRARTTRRDELTSAIQEKLVSQPTQYWIDRFSADKVPCSRINRLEDVASDVQIAHRRLFTRAIAETGEEFVAICSPFSRDGAGPSSKKVPKLGESTEEILRSVGCSEAEISALRTEWNREPGPTPATDDDSRQA